MGEVWDKGYASCSFSVYFYLKRLQRKKKRETNLPKNAANFPKKKKRKKERKNAGKFYFPHVTSVPFLI